MYELHGLLFDWDSAKAARNLYRHRVSFEAAAHVLADPEGYRRHVTFYDERHSRTEDRFITLGPVPVRLSVLLTVVWTESEQSIRIISARRATQAEEYRYAEETNPNR